MKSLVASFVCGVIFAVGLAVSGMTQPGKVVAFLDLAGSWDPSLAFVMVGAIGLHAVAWLVARRLPSPLLVGAFSPLPRTRVDRSLVIGSLLFGVGWGLSGVCPGPALVTAATGMRATLVLVPAMIAGMYLYRLVEKRRGAEMTDETGIACN